MNRDRSLINLLLLAGIGLISPLPQLEPLRRQPYGASTGGNRTFMPGRRHRAKYRRAVHKRDRLNRHAAQRRLRVSA